MFAKSGAAVAALISARGTSVCASRNIMRGGPFAAAPQIGVSVLASDMSAAAGPASARMVMPPASNVANAVPANAAALTEASSVCDCVDVAM